MPFFFLFSGVSRLNYANPPVTPHCLIYRLTFFVRHGEINKENSILQFLLLISAFVFQMLLSILQFFVKFGKNIPQLSTKKTLTGKFKVQLTISPAGWIRRLPIELLKHPQT